MWKTFKFGECAALVNGRAYSQHELLPDGRYQVIRIQNLNGGTNWYYSGLELGNDKYCENGDLLFAWSASFGPYIWRGTKAIFHYHIWKVNPKLEILDRDFAYLLLSQITEKIKAGAHGVAMLHFTKEGMEDYEISLPSLTEQRRIAARLKTQLAAVEDARKAAQAQLLDYKRLIPSILETAFADTADAQLVRIGDVAKTASGTTPSRGRKEYWGPPKYPWVKTGEVTFTPIRRTEELVSERALAECSLPLLPPGTVLIAMYGQGKTRGQSAILEIEATTNQACFAILPNETFDPEYLQLWLRLSYEAMRAQSEARGGNQSNLNGEILSGLEVPLITRKRQQAIAKAIKLSLDEAERLKSALMKQMDDIDQISARLLAHAFNEA